MHPIPAAITAKASIAPIQESCKSTDMGRTVRSAAKTNARPTRIMTDPIARDLWFGVTALALVPSNARVVPRCRSGSAVRRRRAPTRFQAAPSLTITTRSPYVFLSCSNNFRSSSFPSSENSVSRSPKVISMPPFARFQATSAPMTRGQVTSKEEITRPSCSNLGARPSPSDRNQIRDSPSSCTTASIRSISPMEYSAPSWMVARLVGTHPTTARLTRRGICSRHARSARTCRPSGPVQRIVIRLYA